MKGKPFLIMASILLFMVSCDKKEQINLNLTFDQNKKQLVFFSDEDEYEQEVSYYDAIIELKRDFPEEVKNMKILTATDSEEYFNTFQVDHCPTLLVYYKNEVIIEIEGQATIEEIIAPVASVLSTSY
jgi:hypothetical protein